MKGKGMKLVWALFVVMWATLAGAQEQQSISDAEMALGYYQPLAEQGEPYAQLTIGEIYMEGAGVEQDLIQAYAWFSVALHQGVDEAEGIIAHLLEEMSVEDRAQAQAIAAQYIEHFSR